jgi:hypothetical protein
MKRIIFSAAYSGFLITVLFSLVASSTHQEQLQIQLTRNWGFSSGTGKIQGTFSIRTTGPGDLRQVSFYLDEQNIGEVNEPPFTLQFVTDDYPAGIHEIRALGFTDNGAELTSNIIRVEFVPAGEGWQSAMNIIIPIAVIVLVAVGLAVGVPFIFTRGRVESLPPGTPRNYGAHGGAICPKCGRPFSRHIYGLNLGTHKFDRCPYCGKWSLVRRASSEALAAAEAAELESAQAGVFEPRLTEEEQQKRDLEESRYEDL